MACRRLLLLLISALLAVATDADAQLRITGSDTMSSRVAMAVLDKAYARLGIRVEFTLVPLRRSLLMANKGESDGDLMRTEQALQEFDQLLPIKVPVQRIVFFAYQRGRDCPAHLDPAGLHFSYLRGVRVIEMTLPASSLVAASDSREALRSLQKGHVDAMLVDPLEAETLLGPGGMAGICKVAEPLIERDLFHSLNRRHAQLAVRVEKALAEMAARGEIARIWAEQNKLLAASPAKAQ
ncbi:ABC transporter substrate-binding protein [Pelomonas sp. KK5]|uniref:substrate-binding periplasmic protein n=1 Tax=Pelomonas sp. KK5 TaxID=1855730 RepID=UPI00097C1671|nr:transporter substrate-binding domain-containing protein [Pelomonas sp. KK5]